MGPQFNNGTTPDQVLESSTVPHGRLLKLGVERCVNRTTNKVSASEVWLHTLSSLLWASPHRAVAGSQQI